MPSDADYAWIYNEVRDEWIPKEPRADGGSHD